MLHVVERLTRVGDAFFAIRPRRSEVFTRPVSAVESKAGASDSRAARRELGVPSSRTSRPRDVSLDEKTAAGCGASRAGG